MSAPVATFELKDGSQLTLFANRLVHEGGGAMEIVPLAHLASVRVAYERDARLVNRAAILIVVALFLLLISGPMLNFAVGASARVVGNESLESILRACLSVVAGIARLLPWLGALLLAIAAVMGAFFVTGATVLTLSFGASERSFAMRGRNQPLQEFADVIGEQLARRGVSAPASESR